MLERWYKILVWMAGFLWISTAVLAQNTKHPFYKFSHLSSRDGLPQSSVLAVLQDDTGFLWFGTDDGLARYDGYKFKVFQHDPNNPHSISNNVIRGLVQDDYGFIWIATEGGGIIVFNPLSENFVSLIKSGEHPSLAKSPKVFSLIKDSHGEIWAATLSSGIIRIGYATKPEKTINSVIKSIRVRQYEKNSPNESGLNDNKIWTIYENQDQEIWVGTYEGGLQSFDRTTEKFTNSPLLYNNTPVKSIKAYFEDSKGNIWIGTEHFGLFRKNKRNGKLIHYPFGENVGSRGTLHYNITDFIEDDQGQIWIGTLGGGLSIFDSEEQKFYHYQDNRSDPYSLKGNSVFTFYQDKGENLWIGMYSGEGLNKVTPKKQYFEYYQASVKNSSDGLSGKMVKAVYQDSTGSLWVGIFNGGLNQLKPSQDGLRYFFAKPEDPKSLSHNNVQCITRGENGTLWIGTDGGGLNLFNPDKGLIKVYRSNPEDENSLSKDEIWALCKDHQGSLWVGTANGGGLNRFNPVTEKFEQFKHEENNPYTPSFNDIRVLYLDKKNNLWIGTYGGGLNKYDFQSGKFIYYKHTPSNPKSISHNIITSIQEDNKGNLWIGTFGGGLNKFNPATEEFTTFRKKDGLPSDVVKAILQDEQGCLWISTVNGLSRYNPALGVFKNFNVNDGLLSNEFNLGSAFKDASGKMYFGGTNGLNAFYPEKFEKAPKLQAPVITSLRVLNKLVMPQDTLMDMVILQKSITHTSSLSLLHQHNSFEFEFSALQFSGQDNLNYAYKLEGFDDSWVVTDADRRYAAYANLKPGDYVFKVKASYEQGFPGSEERTIRLAIHPPWWKSSTAYFIYFVILCLTFYGIYHIISFRIRLKNNLRFERLEYQKQEEVNQLKLRFFTNISHELRTPLMLISAPLEQLLSKQGFSETVQRELVSIQTNTSRLLRLINQLLDFRKQETGNLTLSVREENFISFIEKIVTSFEGLANQRHIQLHLTVEKDLDPMIWFDPDQLEKVFYNLCYNAFKFTPEGGMIRIHLSSSFITDATPQHPVPCLAVSVTDNGKGIKPEYQEKIFERFFQINHEDWNLSAGTGIGLALSKNLVEFHKGTIEVFSVPERETTFNVKLRKGKSHYQSHEMAPEPDQKQITTEFYPKLQNPGDEFLEASNILNTEDESLITLVKGEKLLIVDDNQELLVMMKSILGRYFQILTATNGIEGLEVAKNDKPDFIISDVMMPEMDGVEMCGKIKQSIETSHIPVILLTAKTTHSSQVEGYESGADDYLSKPFPLDLLILKVKNLLESRKRLKERFKKTPDLEPSEIVVTSADEELMKSAMQIAEAHIDDTDFDIPLFVKEMGISRTLLYEKLKAITGLTPNEFIQTMRLKRAAQLLLKSDLGVAEVCYTVGFNNPKYFSKCFQKQFDCLPSKYAEKNKEVTGSKVDHPKVDLQQKVIVTK